MGLGLLSAYIYGAAQQGKGDGEATRFEAGRSQRPCSDGTIVEYYNCALTVFSRRISMKSPCKSLVVLSSVVLLCCAALIVGPKVSAAGEGKISGTVKLDGTAPHMKGIDMSKDPFCAKAHASDPGHLETVVVGSGGGL